MGEKETFKSFTFTTFKTSLKIWLSFNQMGAGNTVYIPREVNSESYNKNFGMGRIFIVAQ